MLLREESRDDDPKKPSKTKDEPLPPLAPFARQFLQLRGWDKGDKFPILVLERWVWRGRP